MYKPTFPASLQGEVKLERHKEKFFLGTFANYVMTKGRLYYGDYSGETFADQNVSRFSVGLIGGAKIATHLNIYGKLGTGINFAKLLFGTSLYDEMISKEKERFHSYAFLLESGVSRDFQVKRLILQPFLGFEVNISTKTIYNENKEAYLVAGDDKAFINWSGLRFGLGLGLAY